jgi:hypothetical protein
MDKEPVGLNVLLTETEGHPEGLKLTVPEVVNETLGVEERDGVDVLQGVAVPQSVVLIVGLRVELRQVVTLIEAHVEGDTEGEVDIVRSEEGVNNKGVKLVEGEPVVETDSDPEGVREVVVDKDAVKVPEAQGEGEVVTEEHRVGETELDAEAHTVPLKVGTIEGVGKMDGVMLTVEVSLPVKEMETVELTVEEVHPEAVSVEEVLGVVDKVGVPVWHTLSEEVKEEVKELKPEDEPLTVAVSLSDTVLVCIGVKEKEGLKVRVKGFEVTTGVMVVVIETEEDKLVESDPVITTDGVSVKGLEEATGDMVVAVLGVGEVEMDALPVTDGGFEVTTGVEVVETDAEGLAGLDETTGEVLAVANSEVE